MNSLELAKKMYEGNPWLECNPETGEWTCEKPWEELDDYDKEELIGYAEIAIHELIILQG